MKKIYAAALAGSVLFGGGTAAAYVATRKSDSQNYSKAYGETLYASVVSDWFGCRENLRRVDRDGRTVDNQAYTLKRGKLTVVFSSPGDVTTLVVKTNGSITRNGAEETDVLKRFIAVGLAVMTQDTCDSLEASGRAFTPDRHKRVPGSLIRSPAQGMKARPA